MAGETNQSTVDKPPVMWEELVAWATEDTDESWDKIDTVIKSIAHNENYVLHAVGDLKNENRNIRDLAASILEKTSLALADETIVSLKEMLDDEHFYAKFRAACALVKHKAYGERQTDVKTILQDALTDEDEGIVAISQEYIVQLEQK